MSNDVTNGVEEEEVILADLSDEELAEQGGMPPEELIWADGPLRLLTYHRYTTSLTQRRLEKLGLGRIDPEKVAQLDAVDQVEELEQIGRAVAQEQVSVDDLSGFLET